MRKTRFPAEVEATDPILARLFIGSMLLALIIIARAVWPYLAAWLDQ